MPTETRYTLPITGQGHGWITYQNGKLELVLRLKPDLANYERHLELKTALIFALLDTLEDCYPRTVRDWVWARAAELGMVDPEIHP